MAVLLANANGKKPEDNKIRWLRDKALTHMKEVIDEIRRCGHYVFWKDEQKRKGYVSRYHKVKNMNKTKNQTIKEEPVK